MHEATQISSCNPSCNQQNIKTALSNRKKSVSTHSPTHQRKPSQNGLSCWRNPLSLPAKILKPNKNHWCSLTEAREIFYYLICQSFNTPPNYFLDLESTHMHTQSKVKSRKTKTAKLSPFSSFNHRSLILLGPEKVNKLVNLLINGVFITENNFPCASIKYD